MLDSGAVEKKRVYRSAVEDRRRNFTPFVQSIDGLLQREASHFLKHLSASLASKWEKSFSEVVAYVRARLESRHSIHSNVGVLSLKSLEYIPLACLDYSLSTHWKAVTRTRTRPSHMLVSSKASTCKS